MGYPIQLKEAVLKKVLEGNKTRHEIAKRFGIGKSTIGKWIKEYKLNGSVNLNSKEKRPSDWTLEERMFALLETGLKERLKRFGLELHPKKTRLLRFGRFAMADCHKDGRRKPETFDFLGFTHYCTKAYRNGWFVAARETIKKKMRAQLQFIKIELRRRINRPIAETGAWLHRALSGHLNYYSS
jgi:transposase-like protein